MNRIWPLLALPLLIAGCLPEAPPPPEPEPAPVATEQGQMQMLTNPSENMTQAPSETLLAELMQMAAEPEKHEMSIRGYELTDTLAAREGTPLEPFVGLLSLPETPGQSRLFVLRCVNGTLGAAYLPQLETMLDSEDWSTRSCATTLIGSIQDPRSVEVLEGLRDDSNERIAFAALSGLAIQSGDPYRAELTNLYFKEDTSEEWRNEIVRVLLIEPRPDDSKILEAVLMDPTTLPEGRDWITMVLANFGSPESIPVLEKSMELDDRESYRSMTTAAIEFIRSAQAEATESDPAPEPVQ